MSNVIFQAHPPNLAVIAIGHQVGFPSISSETRYKDALAERSYV
ncbi:MAG: hypothetical protein ACI9G1_003163 [Pirellulaceae bacterium]|jgi:hypothetical protein